MCNKEEANKKVFFKQNEMQRQLLRNKKNKKKKMMKNVDVNDGKNANF